MKIKSNTSLLVVFDLIFIIIVNMCSVPSSSLSPTNFIATQVSNKTSEAQGLCTNCAKVLGIQNVIRFMSSIRNCVNRGKSAVSAVQFCEND